ncbi:mitochondrial proton/calcium exchanger protein-like protein isoform X1 [Tanacetum coccineum]
MAEYSQKWHNGTSRTRSTETSDGLAAIQAQLNNLGREIKKVNEKVYAAQDWGYRATALGFYQRNNTNPLYQERRQFMEDTLSKFMSVLEKRHEDNSNLIKEIRASTDAAIRNQGASIKTLEIQIGQMSKVLQERGFGSLPSSTETNPRDHVKSISTIVESCISNLISVVISPNTVVTTGTKPGKTPGSFTLPCFINNVCFDNAIADLGASISVMPLSTYLNLGLGKLARTKLTVELADRTVKYLKGIAKNMLVGIGKFVFPIYFIILDMPEDIKVPLILGRPFLSTARAKIDVFKRNITLRVREEKIIFKSVKPASSLIKRVYMLSLRERMKLYLEARLMDETLVLNRSLDHFFEDCIELNDLNVPLELRRDQVDDLMPTFEEGEVIEEFRARNDATMAIIFGELFLREVGINAKRFDGMITIHNGNEEVTYQMARSHPRFKHHTNEQCNKIPPLLKVSEEDKMNRISHSYQKLNGFYKGVLNLGYEYVRDAKMEEWLTRGHISVHETE